jgi:hypothetical protein
MDGLEELHPTPEFLTNCDVKECPSKSNSRPGDFVGSGTFRAAAGPSALVPWRHSSRTRHTRSSAANQPLLPS